MCCSFESLVVSVSFVLCGVLRAPLRRREQQELAGSQSQRGVSTKRTSQLRAKRGKRTRKSVAAPRGIQLRSLGHRLQSRLLMPTSYQTSLASAGRSRKGAGTETLPEMHSAGLRNLQGICRSNHQMTHITPYTSFRI